ncbi:response regulator [Gallaecimonas sp. GXIMD1310]|uniref:response regulator n=1 Tax=Gallaecimonas sp. GXIMD1310 TaxID=3131926 RepID=UPI003246B60E
MKVLVVEDDNLLRHHLKVQLSERGFGVHAAPNAEEARFFAEEYELDVAIVDLGLPGMNGISLIRTFREEGKTFPIIILTARGNWQDKVEGLDAGADDYLVKPFQMEELVARLQALSRRAAGFASPTIEAQPFKLDLAKKQAFRAEDPLTLTAYEYKLLEFLMRHHQEVVSKQRLVEQLYDDHIERDSNVVEVLIGRLRKKLDPDNSLTPIETIRGQGYMFRLTCQ